MLSTTRILVGFEVVLFLSSAIPLIRTEQVSGEPASSTGARPLGYRFLDVSQRASLHFHNYFGGETAKKYILETTGSGAAFFDYDQDGWPDIFLVNGSRLTGL